MDRKASAMKIAEMGRVKKISTDPWEMSSDCPREVYSICARTLARTIGAMG